MPYPLLGVPSIASDDVTGLNHPIILPDNLVTGQLLLLFISCDEIPTITLPPFWTKLFDAPQATQLTGSLAYGWVNGSEDDDLTWETSNIQKVETGVWPVSYAHPSTPPEAVSAIGGNFNPNPANLILGGWGAEHTLWTVFVAMDGITTVLTVPSADYINLTNHGVSTSGGTRIAKYTRRLIAASENPGPATMNVSQDWVTGTVAIRPAIDTDDPVTLRRSSYLYHKRRHR